MTEEPMVERALAAFNGGLVKLPDPKTPSGFRVEYRPQEAMRAALTAANVDALVEALRVIAAEPVPEPNRSNWEEIAWDHIALAKAALAHTKEITHDR